jgi:hypothetical protein
MKKRKYYYSTRFSVAIIKEAYDVFLSKLDSNKPIGNPQELTITNDDVQWSFDSLEEWLVEYPYARTFDFDYIVQGNRLIIMSSGTRNTYVSVEFPSRPLIESVFQILERHVDESKIATEEEPITIFIGHGHDAQWRDLKDHLTDQHGIHVIAYEVGPRAGLSVKDVLEDMLEETSLALLVLTGEDIHADGELHARENVIHEVGLFQGSLGFTRAIVLLEENVKEFSNILGINQIRFSKGRIRETFGDVIALVKREFESEDN